MRAAGMYPFRPVQGYWVHPGGQVKFPPLTISLITAPSIRIPCLVVPLGLIAHAWARSVVCDQPPAYPVPTSISYPPTTGMPASGLLVLSQENILNRFQA